MLNTLAGQIDIVEKFRNGVDLYSELASQFYGFEVDKTKPAERGTGKQLELSCGYGAGGPTIVRTARAGTYGPPVYLSDEQGVAARDLYRGTHPFVVALWKEAERRFSVILNGGTCPWRGCMTIHDHRIFHNDSSLWLDFTSLEYHTENGESYWRHRVRNGWRKTYGARLIENVVQWLARMVISQAMVRSSNEWPEIRIPLTVHDDVHFLIPRIGLRGLQPEEILAELKKEMERPLTWLPECPISAEADLLETLA